MATKLELLNVRFRLLEHPFDPKTDPKAEPVYSFNGRSLRQSLKIYRYDDQRKYFVRVGPFAKAAEAGEEFMEKWNSAQGPPSVIAFGPKHGGLESLAGYVASLIRDAAPSPELTRFHELGLVADTSLAFLEQLAFLMRAHVKDINLAGARALFEGDKTEAASEPVLAQQMGMLKAYTAEAPWLVVFVRPVTYKRMHLVEKYLELLTELRIAPIFMTNDLDVYTHFEDWKSNDVLHLRIDSLTSVEGLELLRERLRAFRADPPPIVHPSFPYLPGEVEKLFLEGHQPIGFLLDRYYGALEEKLKQERLESKADAQIDWNTISRDFDEELRKAVKSGA